MEFSSVARSLLLFVIIFSVLIFIILWIIVALISFKFWTWFTCIFLNIFITAVMKLLFAKFRIETFRYTLWLFFFFFFLCMDHILMFISCYKFLVKVRYCSKCLLIFSLLVVIIDAFECLFVQYCVWHNSVISILLAVCNF